MSGRRCPSDGDTFSIHPHIWIRLTYVGCASRRGNGGGRPWYGYALRIISRGNPAGAPLLFFSAPVELRLTGSYSAGFARHLDTLLAGWWFTSGI